MVAEEDEHDEIEIERLARRRRSGGRTDDEVVDELIPRLPDDSFHPNPVEHRVQDEGDG